MIEDQMPKITIWDDWGQVPEIGRFGMIGVQVQKITVGMTGDRSRPISSRQVRRSFFPYHPRDCDSVSATPQAGRSKFTPVFVDLVTARTLKV